MRSLKTNNVDPADEPKPFPEPSVFDALIREWYVTDERHFVVRPKDVSNAVAVALGLPWSPKLGAEVRLAVEALGGYLITDRDPLYAGIRPKGLDRRKARKLSTQLRTFVRERWRR